MKFVVVEDGRCGRVVAEAGTSEGLSLLEEELLDLASCGKPNEKAVAGLFAVFKAVADHGRQRAARFYHEANKDEHIYEFSKGDLRVYFFFSADCGELFICSHAIRKRKQKADPADITKAVKLRQRVERAFAQQQVQYEFKATRGRV